MFNKNLIITSGASQLLIQIATLKFLNHNLNNFDIIYIGVEKQRLKKILNLIGVSCGMQFIGSIDNLDDPKPIFCNPVVKLSFLKHLFYASSRKKKEVESLFPILRKYRKRIVVIPIRHKMIGDVMLLHYLEPSKTIITADGVVNTPKIRNIKALEWTFIRTKINELPITSPIYAPEYLAMETRKLGNYKAIPSNEINETLNRVRNSFCDLNHQELLNIKPVKSIIFSQHLGISNVCSNEQEINFYVGVSNYLISKNLFPILIKTHPRDCKEKILKLTQRLKDISDKVSISSPSVTAVPVELLNIGIMTTHLITVNSSAPLTLSHLNSTFYCFYSRNFSQFHLSQIKLFAKSNNAKLIEIDN